MKKAIYPGSFDPFTLGHMDIAKRALTVFDHLYIAIGENRTKRPLFTSEERKLQLEELYKDDDRVSIITFNKLLVDLAGDLDTYTVVRGLRAVSDFDIEFQMALLNRKLEPRLESIFFMTSDNYAFLSSSIIKEIACMKGKSLADFVPPNVEAQLKRKFQ
jgi:pantetheine-phosphate adenylyltransferase